MTFSIVLREKQRDGEMETETEIKDGAEDRIRERDRQTDRHTEPVFIHTEWRDLMETLELDCPALPEWIFEAQIFHLNNSLDILGK